MNCLNRTLMVLIVIQTALLAIRNGLLIMLLFLTIMVIIGFLIDFIIEKFLFVEE